jgi:hypothetical protein
VDPSRLKPVPCSGQLWATCTSDKEIEMSARPSQQLTSFWEDSGPLRATTGHFDRYSITSSAVARSVGGILRPSAFAAFKLITRLNLVGVCAGRSLGFSPCKILST